MNWNHLADIRLGAMVYLSRSFADMESRNPRAFPNFSGERGLILASDYSRCHHESKFDVSSFVLIGLSSF
jgi:hypothetical protein